MKERFFHTFMLSQQKIEKTVHFFEHQYLMNQCMFLADILVKKKPEPKFFDNSYIFHNGGHFDLRTKIGKICFLVSSKNKGKLFLGIILAQILLQILNNIT